MTIVIVIMLVVLMFFVRSRKSSTRQPLPGSPESRWGNMGDYDVGDKVFDEGELFDWPYYRNVGWSWWFNKHDKCKPKSVKGTVLDCDGSLNMGPPSFVEEKPSSFSGKLFDDKMPLFAYAPPVGWIETHG